MILSSLYHTFTCHSPKWSGTCLTLDLIGIIMAILATYLSGIYYAFWCEPYWRDFYLTTVGGFFIIGKKKKTPTIFQEIKQFYINFSYNGSICPQVWKWRAKCQFPNWAIYVLGNLWHRSYNSLGFSPWGHYLQPTCLRDVAKDLGHVYD